MTGVAPVVLGTPGIERILIPPIYKRVNDNTFMASITSTPSFLCSSTHGRSTTFAFSVSAVIPSKNSRSRLSTSVPQLGFGLFPPWSGLRHLGLSFRQKSLKIEVKRRGRGKFVYASLFGVGAPEALVIGVVALLVFGPKGLAEVARNLGKTLRAFQPTIRELQEVSREFKSTLEREIGLDDIPTENTNRSANTNTTSTSLSYPDTENAKPKTDPNGAPSANRAYSTEDYLKVTEEQLKASATQQQEQTPLLEELSEPKAQPQATTPEVATATPPQSSKTET